MGLNRPIDITADQRKTVLALLSRHLPHTTAWVYGSRVKWTSGPKSDLDLVVFATSEQTGQVSDLREVFEESNLPFRVDLFVWDEIPEQFHKHIEAEHVVLVEREKQGVGADDWTRYTVDQLKSPAPNALATGPFGSAISSRHFIKEGIPVIRGSNLSKDVGTRLNDDGLAFVSERKAKEFSRSLAKTGDLIFTCWGTIDQVGLIDDRSQFQEYVVSNKQMKLTPNPRTTSSLFLYYLFSSPLMRDQILIQGIGSSVPGFNLGQLRSMTLNIPTLPEQRAIARILGTLDDKFELNRRMNQTLEEMARALFKSWFVDFDPVRAKSTLKHHATPPQGGSDWSVERARAYLDSMDPNIAALFPDSFVDSELGPIPEGWEVVALGQCFDVERGLSYKGSALSSSGVPMHNLNSIYEGGGYKYDGIKHYSGDYQPRHVVKPGDVIVANTEQGHHRLLIGFAAVVPKRYGSKSLFSHHIYRVRPKKHASLGAEYICQLLNTQTMHAAVSGYATGTTVNMLPLDALRLPWIVVPRTQVVAAFGAVAETMRACRENIIAASHSVAALRNTLLPKLVSGEVYVEDANGLAHRGRV